MAKKIKTRTDTKSSVEASRSRMVDLRLCRLRRLSGGIVLASFGSLSLFATEPQLISTTPPIKVVVPTNPVDKATFTQKITYTEGQLEINVRDMTLGEILNKVAALTGASMDLAEGANRDPLPIVKLGPGPARQVITALLSDSNFDYLLQGSETDPDKLQSVALMTRPKKDSHGADAPDVPTRSVYARVPPPPSDDPPPAENASRSHTDEPVEASNNAAPDAPASAPGLSDSGLSQRAQANVEHPGALAPPATMDSNSINQQLQQMYQQRMQMMAPASPSPSATPSGH